VSIGGCAQTAGAALAVRILAVLLSDPALAQGQDRRFPKETAGGSRWLAKDARAEGNRQGL